MRAIIIEDKDARALLEKLELNNFLHRNKVSNEEQQVYCEAHRSFHSVVCKWLQEQGCDVTSLLNKQGE